MFRTVSDHWWVSALAMYMPPILFAIPIGALSLALLSLGRGRWLWTQVVAAVLLVFPLMGFVPPSTHGRASGPRLRIMSYNVHVCAAGFDALAARIEASKADVVLLQEICGGAEPFVERLRRNYPLVRTDGQFLLASRYRSIETPMSVPFSPKDARAGFVRYVLDTSIGRLSVYSLHPISPRALFDALRRVRVRAIELGALDGVAQANAALREQQLMAATAAAAIDPNRVVLAGDTNLPGVSPTLTRDFARYQDGFAAIGWGFGYTFPSRHPFLRLDRMFAGRGLHFTDFSIGCGIDSDHRCVIGELSH
ncbi:MAG TPA: endonuclease/exonuclease/phosphatase family protein [Polyangiales bacterium]